MWSSCRICLQIHMNWLALYINWSYIDGYIKHIFNCNLVYLLKHVEERQVFIKTFSIKDISVILIPQYYLDKYNSRLKKKLIIRS